MGAILNGIIRAFGDTFLIFSDYLRPAVRLTALEDVGDLIRDFQQALR